MLFEALLWVEIIIHFCRLKPIELAAEKGCHECNKSSPLLIGQQVEPLRHYHF